ncbi:MAG: hypothetical protein K9G26_09165 [Emcibacter sp.]|nr:hypothetical protein [Emcibacter sp.]
MTNLTHRFHALIIAALITIFMVTAILFMSTFSGNALTMNYNPSSSSCALSVCTLL